MREQGYNKRNTFMVSYKGVEYSLPKIAYENNIKRETIWHGMRRGKSFSYYVEKYNLKLE